MGGSGMLLGVSVFLAGTAAISVYRSPVPRHISRFNQAFEILPKANNSMLDHVHRVYGAWQCGGQGRFLSYRYKTCNSTTGDLCQVPVNDDAQGELAFIPRESADSLGVRITVKDPSQGEKPVMEMDNPQVKNSHVKGGNEYILSGGYSNEAYLKGSTLYMQMSIYRTHDQVEELCVRADYRVI